MKGRTGGDTKRKSANRWKKPQVGNQLGKREFGGGGLYNQSKPRSKKTRA